MNVMNELDHWHELIKPEGVDLVALYKKLTLDELSELQQAETPGEIIKEACDVVVTARGLILALDDNDNIQGTIHGKLMSAMMELVEYTFGVDFDHALHLVNQSNFSKLVLSDQIRSTLSYFEEANIAVIVLPLDNTYWGAYSALDQTVKGKEYPKDKLLKAHTYKAIDESKEWWL